MSASHDESPLNAALRQFELAEANLVKLEKIWHKYEVLLPGSVVFGNDPELEDCVRSYEHILKHLPAIGGVKPETVPMSQNAVAQSRMDANEIGEFECTVATEEAIQQPGAELREYRFHFKLARRKLVREALEATISSIDDTLRAMQGTAAIEHGDVSIIQPNEWDVFKQHVASLAALLGEDIPKKSRWHDLQRHISFGETGDLRDIIGYDWPELKARITRGMVADDEPHTLAVRDLADLVRAKPTGPISAKLAWKSLDAANFERLIWMVVDSEPGYERAELLMATNAPDRGRDVSAYRVKDDGLTGAIRERVIIQCKHWLSKSLSLPDVATMREQMKLWQPPRVDVLVVATTGCFTADAVDYVEKHNQSDSALTIEMWPQTRLERLLAARPHLIAEFGLR